MTRRPIIGITPDINDNTAPETEYVVRKNYADAVLRAGGVPVILPFSANSDAYFQTVDGLLVTGGMFDIDPQLYRQIARKQYVTKPERTAFEKALVEGARERGMPILGICNGMQLLAVCLGGELVQDIPSDIEGAFEHKPAQSATVAQHEVQIVNRSRHLELASGGMHAVNSVHHQSVLPAEAYNVLAAASDSVIEAIEAKEGGFAVGVQWHAEYCVSQIDDAVWSGFLAAASKYSSSIRRPS
ncbi:gamma-glutamyl-gamma-aminobutyrate hydrolase family protein [Sinorhizobium meliloti]|uniref:gamma-glutamyl-gamma-aminobutyrate hydrolase family protein n=1 Tax=Rhizobium meliloti TaxID=382 RepID=UPI0001E4B9FF|nr:gamma-glutamyl-gamma-aminobutyrate hydrolase family protein [Sinorhizobium meliloti]AEG58081.1 peptidase C26 [Sinorhizobium meliloti AK83]MDE4589052.1 gamma-glutamyl-gamma-aminobutyrate hydrolase family protein [Sinorhizobium meliloti]SEJ84553.1 putative glutamine amidotransferase [Sinorhizobium meliloti]